MKDYNIKKEYIVEMKKLVGNLLAFVLVFCTIGIYDIFPVKAEQQDLYNDLIELDEYVTPEQFGAKGDSVTDDTQAFIKMFDDIKERRKVIDKNKSSDVDNITAPVCVLKPGTQYCIKNAVSVSAPFVRIIGNGAKIVSDNNNRVFSFETSSSGWQTEIDDVEFFRCKEPIWFNYQNVECGKIIINSCRFHQCTGYAITTQRRSCHVFISKCMFSDCDRYWHSDCNDMSVFEDNWASGYNLTENDRTPIKISKDNAKNTSYSCRIVNNIFVPEKATENNPMPKSRAWISCDIPDITIEKNRFGGEEGSMPIINVTSEMSRTDYVPTSCVRVINNMTANNTGHGNKPRVINLYGLPTLMEIIGNQGFNDTTMAVEWDESVSKSTQDSLIEKQKNHIKIIMFANTGRHVEPEFDEGKSNFPENLLPYVNKNIDFDLLDLAFDFKELLIAYRTENEQLKTENEELRKALKKVNEKTSNNTSESEKKNVNNSKLVGSKFSDGKVIYKVVKTGENHGKKRGEVSVVGIKNKSIKKVSIKSRIVYGGIFYNVTSIGKKAFAKGKKLEKIIIKSKKVKRIYKGAFNGLKRKCVIKIPKTKRKTYLVKIKKAGFKGKIR